LGTNRIALQLSPAQHDACHKLACLSLTLLKNRITVFPDLFKTNFDAFLESRCGEKNLPMTYSECAYEMREYFGDEYFRWCGIPDSHQRADRLLFGGKVSLNQAIPMKIILLAAFCSGMEGRDLFGSRQFRSGRRALTQPPVLCINHLAAHGQNYLIAQTTWRKGRFHAKCNCGMYFTFDERAGEIAVSPKVARWGAGTKQRIADLWCAGWTYSAIASNLEISCSHTYRIVKRLLNGRSAQDGS
jgi:hypothetical protein